MHIWNTTPGIMTEKMQEMIDDRKTTLANWASRLQEDPEKAFRHSEHAKKAAAEVRVLQTLVEYGQSETRTPMFMSALTAHANQMARTALQAGAQGEMERLVAIAWQDVLASNSRLLREWGVWLDTQLEDKAA